jgi:hypothetical protein
MQQDEVIPPWEQEYPDMGFGKSAALTVTKKSEKGTVTCKIIRDGKEWRISTSSAAYGSASCSGIVGT